jgi:N6-adenosine-specific RNA methylase IME4
MAIMPSCGSAINAERHALAKTKREVSEKLLASQIKALPDQKYGCLYVDPPWRFETWSDKGKTNTSADNHYATSDLSEIQNLDIERIAADNCALFLWATVPMLPQAIDTMIVWGFKYVTNFVWVKHKIGTGYWTRNKHEILLVGVRGNVPAPAPGTQYESVIEAAVGSHSAKPDCFSVMIETMFPNLPKIELYRRGPARPGWDAWGAEAEAEAETRRTG